MAVEKDILYPGVYTLPTGGRWECTAQDVHSACVNGNKMLAAGNTAAPLIWEHDWNAVPTPLPKLLSWLGDRVRDWAAGYAKHTFGYASGFRVGIDRGEPVLYSANTIPRAGDRAQFEATRFVSPRVDRDYTDHNGRFWPGTVIGHIASTPTPVQMRQQPVMLSAAGLRPQRCTARVSVFLSLGSSSMADDDKSKDKGGDKDKGGKGGDVWGRIKAAMSNLGIEIPDGCSTPEDYALAIETAAMNKGGDAPPADDLPDLSDDDDMGAATTPALTPAMLSSIPGLTAEQRAALEHGIKASAAQVAAGRSDLTRRLDRVKARAVADGHLTGAEVGEMAAKFAAIPDAVMLSTMAGQPTKSRAVMKLEMLERFYKVGGSKTPAGKKPVHLSTVPVPTPAAGQPTGTSAEGVERARAAARERLANRRQQPAATK